MVFQVQLQIPKDRLVKLKVLESQATRTTQGFTRRGTPTGKGKKNTIVSH